MHNFGTDVSSDHTSPQSHARTHAPLLQRFSFDNLPAIPAPPYITPTDVNLQYVGKSRDDSGYSSESWLQLSSDRWEML